MLRMGLGSTLVQISKNRRASTPHAKKKLFCDDGFQSPGIFLRAGITKNWPSPRKSRECTVNGIDNLFMLLKRSFCDPPKKFDHFELQ